MSGPLLRVSVDALDQVEAGAFVGWLVGVLVLLAVPVLLLGCVAPYRTPVEWLIDASILKVAADGG